MSKEKKMIPELRFPEFVKGEEWVEKQLGNVFTSFSGGTPNTSEKEYYGGCIPFIRSAEINKRNTQLFINEKGLDNSSAKVVNKGDLLIALYGANSGDVAISKIDGAINQAILCLKSSYSNVFAYHFLSLQKNWIVTKYIQGGQGNLSGDIVKSIKLPLPDKAEQQKIASCLSSLDELITAHSDKLQTLKDHKKGLMQNLFPQEGETVPKYRFKEFEDDGEWVEKKLGDKEVSFFANRKISIKKLKLDSYLSTENMLPDYSGIRIASKLPVTGSFTKFINGDILISNIRPYLKKVWKADMEGGASNDVLVFRAGSEVLSEFLEFIIKNDAFIHYVMKSAKGVKMPRGDKNAMQEYLFMVPLKKEQQKIADCLSSLDELIKAQAEKIAQLQLHKKGLMQGLFPKIVA